MRIPAMVNSDSEGVCRRKNMENMTWVKLHSDSLWNPFFAGLVDHLKSKLKIIEIDGRPEYTCGAVYHHPSISDWHRFRFRHLEEYCLAKGFDDMVVMELIIEKTGRKIICECELVNDVAADKRARLRRSFGIDLGEPGREDCG